jgi:hypothetical protein
MNLTPLLTTKLEIGAAVALVVVSGIALREHDQHIKEAAVAAAVVQTEKQAQATYQQQVSDLAKQMADREAQYQADKKAADARFQQAASPAQIASLVAQLMGLKQPIQIVQPLPTAANPNPAPIAEVSTLDAPQVKAYVQQCEECKLNLSKATADAADRQAQANLAQLQIASLQKENTALTIEAHGGTVWQRTKRALRYIAWGAGGAAVAICASGHCR